MPMDIERVIRFLDHPDEAARWFTSLGLEDARRACRNLEGIARSGMTLDLLAVICTQLERHLPRISDPDMAVNNLDHFVAAARNPLSLGSLFERDEESLPTLLQIFSSSQFLSDWLVRDPEAFDLLRLTEGQPVSREALRDDICSQVAGGGRRARGDADPQRHAGTARCCGSPTAMSCAGSRWRR